MKKIKCFEHVLKHVGTKLEGFIFTTLIFIVIYEWAKKGRVFVPGRPCKTSVMKQPSFLGLLVCYEENEVLNMFLSM